MREEEEEEGDKTIQKKWEKKWTTCWLSASAIRCITCDNTVPMWGR